MPESRAVLITGIGLVTPFAATREESWKAITAGQSATRWLEESWRANFATNCPPNLLAGAPAPPLPTIDSTQDLVSQLALTAAREAMQHARLSPGDFDAHRSGCVIGTSKGGMRSFGECYAEFRNHQEFSAETFLNSFSHQPALAVAREFSLGGPLLCPVAACATGLSSLIRGAELIQSGEADLVLAGSSDASLLPMIQSSFHRLGVLARNFEDPSRACRPFSADHDGFLIGEGAAVMVLESAQHATARRAPVLAEYLTGMLAADTTGITQLDSDPACLVHLLQSLFRRANLSPREISYINLHGTATPPNDAYETRAIQTVFAEAADQLPCSSLKGAIGHLLGAAGSVETACTLLAMRDSRIPPTCHLETPAPDCTLNYTPKHSITQPIETALKLSLGFGGHLAAVLLRKA